MTGAELRAWRERLGKDEAWIGLRLAAIGNDGEGRRRFVEDGAAGIWDSYERVDFMEKYRAALEAEEARQAAERAQAEPVCPEGVTVRRESVYIYVDRAGHVRGSVRADGSVSVVGSTCADRVALRYLLDLADYRARQHAEGDRQRKLDAVRAAEEALDAASHAEEAAHAAYNDAAKARYAAQSTLCNARREAGL